MKLITEIARERLVYHERFDIQKSKPIFTVHRFSIYKLKIIKRLYSSDYGELNFLIQDDQLEMEKCFIYALVMTPNVIHEIKYWRAKEMDKELTGYIIKAFVQGYLYTKYKLTWII